MVQLLVSVSCLRTSALGSASRHRTIAQEMRLLQYVLSTAKRDPRSVCEAMEKLGQEFLGQQGLYIWFKK